tara:strand:+ start:15926 stop:18094 length:2169 start_codon:yes stop_codon:yes gene_type:complete
MRERALAAALILFAGPAFAQSDDCASPEVIAGTGFFSLYGLSPTTSGFDGNGGPNGCVPLTGWDAFWSWNAPNAGTFLFSTCGTGSDSVISLHSGSDCTALCLDYSAAGCVLGSWTSVTLPANEPVLIQVGGMIGTSGVTGMEIIELPAVPPKDTCSAPTPISGLGSWAYTRTGNGTSGFDGGNPAMCSPSSSGPAERDVFFAWTAAAAGDYRIRVCGEADTPVISAYLGTDCSATCVGSSSSSACGPGGAVMILSGVPAGAGYMFQIADGNPGVTVPTDGTLFVDTAPPLPANDGCSAPGAISGPGGFSFNPNYATPSGFDGNGGAPCAGVDHDLDVFLTWTALEDGDWQFIAIAASSDVRMSIYSGSDCSATCLDFDEDGAGGSAPSIVLDGMLAGDMVLIQIGGWDLASSGSKWLRVDRSVPPPTNDTCDTAEPIAGFGAFPFSTQGAGSSGFEASQAACLPGTTVPLLYNDVFFQWTATNAGAHLLYIGSGGAALNVHTGEGCNATCIGASVPPVNDMLVDVQVGDTFLFQLGSFLPGPVDGDLTIGCLSSCDPETVLELLCDPASDHFQGSPVTLGTSFASWQDPAPLHINANGGPSGALGFVLVSDGANAGTNLFNGVLCLNLPMGRYNAQAASHQGLPQLNSLGQFEPNGEFRSNSGTAPSAGDPGFDVPFELPFTPPGQTIVPGDTWYFQLWYRDQVVTPWDSANFSNVLKATF